MPKGIKYSKKRKLATALRDKTQTPTEKRLLVGRKPTKKAISYSKKVLRSSMGIKQNYDFLREIDPATRRHPIYPENSPLRRSSSAPRHKIATTRPENPLEKKIRKSPVGSRWRPKKGPVSRIPILRGPEAASDTSWVRRQPKYMKGVITDLDSAHVAKKASEKNWPDNLDLLFHGIAKARKRLKKAVGLRNKADSLQIEAWRKVEKARPGIMWEEFGKKPPLIKKYKKKRPK